ncbi:hypothetical protein [Streptomyces sp. NPDC088348]|uniref:hypothetical protein n=1 Tax=Streptomyces sp. NPDC088348 TaxID=3365853 RepID=UPI00380B6DBF
MFGKRPASWRNHVWVWCDLSSGAICLENTVIPPGHSGPLSDRCRPDRCGNSMIGPRIGFVDEAVVEGAEANGDAGLFQQGMLDGRVAALGRDGVANLVENAAQLLDAGTWLRTRQRAAF